MRGFGSFENRYVSIKYEERIRLFFKVLHVEDVAETKAVGRDTELSHTDGIAS